MLEESNREGKMLSKIRKASRRTSIYAYPSHECMCVEGSAYSAHRSFNNVHSLDSHSLSVI